MTNSACGEDDLEDGEIFDEEDEVGATPASAGSVVVPPPPVAPPPPVIAIGTFVDEYKKANAASLASKKGGVLPSRPRRKRQREDDRTFRNSKMRRKSGEEDRTKERNFDEEDFDMMGEMSPLRGDDDRFHRAGFPEDLEDGEELDEAETGGGPHGGGGGGRRGRGFSRRRGRSGGRGGGRRAGRRSEGGQPCRFYLIGKCQRGGDCPYSHANNQRKFELCKFYLNDCCVKKERCPYLHSEFPCKFFHLGLKCYAGKKCRLSHSKITPQFKANLLRDSKDCDFIQHVETVTKEEGEARKERRGERVRRKEGGGGAAKEGGGGAKEGGGGAGKEQRRERRKEPKQQHHQGSGGPPAKAAANKESKHHHHQQSHHHHDDDRFTLHFDVDPRTISDDEEGQRTPMPSSPQSIHSESRDSPSPTQAHSPKAVERKSRENTKDTNNARTEVQLPESKDNGGESEDLVPELNPSDLPRHQRELYQRIQLQQKEAAALEIDEDEEEEAKEESDKEDLKEEDWYSSEEEEERREGEKMADEKKQEQEQNPLSALLDRLKQHQQQQQQQHQQQPSSHQQPPSAVSRSPPRPQPPPPPIISSILADFDISAVSKLLSTVRETIQQQKQQNESQQQQQTNQQQQQDSCGTDRLQSSLTAPPPPAGINTTPPRPPLALDPLPPLAALIAETHPPPDKQRRVRDPRLRAGGCGSGGEEDTDLRQHRQQDVDLRQLPFKPAPIVSPATEIDASYSTPPIIPYRLIPLEAPPQPDYSHVSLKNVGDPRLRRYLPTGGLSVPLLLPGLGLSRAVATTGGGTGLRDPRGAAARILPNDPRRKQRLTAAAGTAPSAAVDCDLRYQHQQGFTDIDLRLNPSAAAHLAFK